MVWVSEDGGEGVLLDRVPFWLSMSVWVCVCGRCTKSCVANKRMPGEDEYASYINESADLNPAMNSAEITYMRHAKEIEK